MWIKTLPNNVKHIKDLVWIGLIAVIVISIITANWIYIGNVMKHNLHKEQVLAVIKNSGSSNSPGWTLTILQDGSGNLRYENVSPKQRFFRPYEDKTYTTGAFDSNQLSALLMQIHDVSIIPDHDCLKSVSFGSKTTIHYNGKTSGDLSCLSDNDEPSFINLKRMVQKLNIHGQPGEMM
jgi:hypothetical protein